VTGAVDELALRGGSFSIPFHFEYEDGKFLWTAFESFGENIGIGSFDVNRYDMVHLKDGHIISAEGGEDCAFDKCVVL